MVIVYVLAAVLLAAVVFLAVRWLMKRIKCRSQILQYCEKTGAVLKPLKKRWFLRTRFGKTYDFMLDTAEKTYAVKFIGAVCRHSVLVFARENTFFLRRMVSFGLQVKYTFDGKRHPLPEAEVQTDKPVEKVLLLCPVPMDVRRQISAGKEESLGAGDRVCGALLATTSTLGDVLK